MLAVLNVCLAGALVFTSVLLMWERAARRSYCYLYRQACRERDDLRDRLAAAMMPHLLADLEDEV